MNQLMRSVTENNLSEKIKECVSLLSILADDPKIWVGLEKEERIQLMKAAGRMAHPSREENRQRRNMRAKSRRQNTEQRNTLFDFF